MRNKRLMFVGDSLNRNQWESMICLVQSVVPPGRKSLNKNGSLSVFRIEVIFLYLKPIIANYNSLSMSQSNDMVDFITLFGGVNL